MSYWFMSYYPPPDYVEYVKDTARSLLDSIAKKHNVTDIKDFTCPHARKLARLVGFSPSMTWQLVTDFYSLRAGDRIKVQRRGSATASESIICSYRLNGPEAPRGYYVIEPKPANGQDCIDPIDVSESRVRVLK